MADTQDKVVQEEEEKVTPVESKSEAEEYVDPDAPDTTPRFTGLDVDSVKVMGKKARPINVLIKSGTEHLYEGLAGSVTSVNEQGEFDVLPQHSNFITLVRDFVIVDRGRETEKKFELEKGLLSAVLDDVNVYIGL